jgi:hypothetical protein
MNALTASQVDYGRVDLTWDTPGIPFNKIRVVKDNKGWTHSPTSGTVLLESSIPTNSASDTKVIPGEVGYYTLWVAAYPPAWDGSSYSEGALVLYNGVVYRCRSKTLDSSGVTPTDASRVFEVWTGDLNWVIAGQASLLATEDFGYRSQVYGLIPDPYLPEDDSLERFVGGFGFGFDQIRSQYGLLVDVNNVDRQHSAWTRNAASQYGVKHPNVSDVLLRNQLARQVSLLSTDGTWPGFLDRMRASTGHKFSLQGTATELLPNSDVRDFGRSYIPNYKSGYPYKIGDQVVAVYGGNFLVFQAQVNLPITAPDTIGGTTTSDWLKVTNQTSSRLNNALTGGVGVWETLASTSPNNAWLTMKQGATISGAVGFNYLSAANSSGTMETVFGLRALTINGVTQGPALLANAAKSAAYLPEVLPWVSTYGYAVGDQVVYGGLLFQALTASTGVRPPDSNKSTTAWSCKGTSRKSYTAYGTLWTSSSTDVSANMGVDVVDANGYLMGPTGATYARYTYDQILDGFTTDNTGGLTSVGSYTWAALPGTASTYSQGHSYAYVDPNYSQPTIRGASFDAPSADGQVFLTFGLSPATGTNGLLFRGNSGLTQYLVATRTALISYSSGSITTLATYSQSVGDGDRIQVAYTGLNIVVSAYKAQTDAAYAGPSLITLCSYTLGSGAVGSSGTKIGLYEHA